MRVWVTANKRQTEVMIQEREAKHVRDSLSLTFKGDLDILCENQLGGNDFLVLIQAQMLLSAKRIRQDIELPNRNSNPRFFDSLTAIPE